VVNNGTSLKSSQSVKQKLGGWCEMAASPGVSQLERGFSRGVLAGGQRRERGS
jgi:hypothetical protein